jgi:hypothetical protein
LIVFQENYEIIYLKNYRSEVGADGEKCLMIKATR